MCEGKGGVGGGGKWEWETGEGRREKGEMGGSKKERTYIRITPHKGKTIHPLRPSLLAPITNPGGGGHHRICHQQAFVVQQDERAGEVAAYFYRFRPSLLSIFPGYVEFRALPFDESSYRRAPVLLNKPHPILIRQINRALKNLRP